MSEIARLTLVSHAMTDAMSAGRFPRDEPLNDLGRRQVQVVDRVGRTLSGPELRTRQTAELLGFSAATDPCLADLDCGLWAGRMPDEIEPAELTSWLTDPSAAPHGGESVVNTIARVRDWLGELAPGRVAAVTHPAIVRAAVLVALEAPATSFWRIDVEPAGATVLYRRLGRWTLRLG